MFNFAGNVTDTKTGKSKFVLLSPGKDFWRDDKRIRYDRVTGNGVLARRLHLDTKSIFPIFFTHTGHIKHNAYDHAKGSGKKVFLVGYARGVWMTHQKELFHAGHGFHLMMKNDEILPGDYRRYLVLCSVEMLSYPIDFRKVEVFRNVA
jgi:hypothetical protein